MNKGSLGRDAKETRTIIIGGGPGGYGVANALQEIGQNDFMLFEQADHYGGSGLVSLMHFRTFQESKEAADSINQTIEWYQNLSKEFEGSSETTIYSFPYLYIAKTMDRLKEYESILKINQANGYGQEAKIIDPQEVQKRYPFIDKVDNIAGALLYQNAGWINLTRGFEKIRKDGSENNFFLNTSIQKLIVKDGIIMGVRTNKGDIKAEKVVITGGAFTPHLLQTIDEDQLVLPLPPDKLFSTQKAESFKTDISEIGPGQKLFIINQDGALARFNTTEGADNMAMYCLFDPKSSKSISGLPQIDPSHFPGTQKDVIYSQFSSIMSLYGSGTNPGILHRDPQDVRTGYIVKSPDGEPIISETNISGLYILAALSDIGVMRHIGAGRKLVSLFDKKLDQTYPSLSLERFKNKKVN